MNNNYVYVYSVSGQLAGDIIRILLESINIPAIILQESAGITYGLTVGPLGEVKVYVPADKVDEAKEILLAAEEGKLNSSLYPGLFFSYPEYKKNKFTEQEQFKN